MDSTDKLTDYTGNNWCISFLWLVQQITTNLWLKTIEFYSFEVLKDKSPKSRSLQSCLHSEAPGGGASFLTSSSLWWLQVSSAVAAQFQPPHLPSHDPCMSQISSHHTLVRTPLTEFKTHPDNAGWSYLESINYLCKDLFPHKFALTASR